MFIPHQSDVPLGVRPNWAIIPYRNMTVSELKYARQRANDYGWANIEKHAGEELARRGFQ